MTGRFANIIVDISHEKVDRPFQYIIPDDLKNDICVGKTVLIPFGKGNKLIKGYVMEITDKAEFDISRLKYIASVLNDSMSAQSDMLKLAWWIKNNYGSTMITALKTVLPVKQKMKQVVKKTIVCKVDSKEAVKRSTEFDSKHQKAKARLMRELADNRIIPQTLVTNKLNISSPTIKSLEHAGLIEVIEEDIYRNSIPKFASDNDNVPDTWNKKILSKEQQKIVDQIEQDFDNGIYKTYLLHGITGSGKTEVYMELIEKVISKGKQAIVLIPEIALTYQTLIRFYKRFGDRVSVMNSKLSMGEKSDQFVRATRGEIDIMIGPRSALFTPFENLGLVIIDEEHESSYKSDAMPKYHARDVAEQLCKLKNASLLLGSATPSLEAYYRANKGDIKLFELNNRLAGGKLPKVYIEYLREELKTGNRSIFSRHLHEPLEDRLKKGEQSMLFLNRRGYAGFVSCRSCGYVMKCPHCDVSLSEHTDSFRRTSRLVCHYCGYETGAVSLCPECGSKYILGFRAGTQQIEELLHREFPTARILRMDADTTKSKDSYQEILSKFANEEADILVGTQMIVKGHDFSKVTLVGILAADMSLHASDYRAGERTFQLLTQAAGRAGRGVLEGEVVIQTYQPDNYAITYAAAQDYKGFYSEEIAYRELMMYPPVAQMMAVLIMSEADIVVKEHAQNIADTIKECFKEQRPQVIGPSEAVIGKINDIYRMVVYIKHRDYDVLVNIKDKIENMITELEWNKESIQIDFNPINNY
ncbi:MAG: primosomal protein N' [Lachnospiraceae bacterium]|nr:primosomal protein N' [Lachnospiraceae bacterium]